MDSDTAAASAESLYSNAEFLRNLARNLIHDKHRAEDVVQEAWLASIEKPPKPGIPLGAWLVGITRNKALQAIRSEVRRRRREEAAAVEEELRSTEELVQREAVRRQVVRAVLRLKEPYRSVVLFRYYDDMPPRKIARKLNISVGTVKTRLHRGLEHLRVQLDRDHSGNRKTWCLALAPVAGLKVYSSAGAASTSKAFAWTALTGTPAKIAVSLIVLLSVAWLVRMILSEENIPDRVGIVGPAVESGNDGKLALSADWEENEGRMDAGTERVAVEREGLFISGRVKDRKTGEPIRAFDLEFAGGMMQLISQRVHQTVENEEGIFDIPIEPQYGDYTLTIRTSRHIPVTLDGLEVSENKVPTGLMVELDPGLSISGTVVDHGTGRPVEGAIVGSPEFPSFAMSELVKGYEQYCVHTRTDVSGRFTLHGRLGNRQEIVACHPEFAQTWVEATPGRDSHVEIRLTSGFSIYGKTLNDDLAPAGEILIEVSESDVPVKTCCLSGADGSFRTYPLHPGRVELEANPIFERLTAYPEFTGERKYVTVRDRDVELCFSTKNGNYIDWTGTVYDTEGEPSPMAMIWLGATNRDVSMDGRIGLPVLCDERARFRISKIVPGRYELSAMVRLGANPGQVELGEMELEKTGPMERDIRLDSGSFMDAASLLKRLAEKRDGGSGVKIVLSGFSDLEGEVARISFFPGKTYGRTIQKAFRIEEEGEFSFALDADSYRLFLFTGTGMDRIFYEGDFVITAGEETVIPLSRGDLFRAADSLSVSGNLIGADGIPEPEAKLSFLWDVNAQRPVNEPLAARSEWIDELDRPLIRQARTTRTGRYSVQGIKPGCWKVNAELKGGERIDLPDVLISPSAVDPLILDLVLPGGRISGTFFDRTTGLSFEGGEREWEISLHLEGSEKETVRYVTNRGNRFLFPGILEGNYSVRIDTDGYSPWVSKPFHLSHGQELELEPAGLDPCGELRLSVKDDEGAPIDHYGFEVNGKTIVDLNTSWIIHASYEHEEILPIGEQGVADEVEEVQYDYYDDLPLGNVRVRVRGNGYKSKEVTCLLRPGIPRSIEVILEKR